MYTLYIYIYVNNLRQFTSLLFKAELTIVNYKMYVCVYVYVCVESVCARGAQLSLGHVHSEQAAGR